MNTPKRLALYAFHDENGHAGEYVKYCLKALREAGCRVIVIAGRELQPESRQALESIGAEILTVKNPCTDFGAWQEAILVTGFPELTAYDELILCSSGCYGPFRPLSGLFPEMETRHSDFWGITRGRIGESVPLKYDAVGDETFIEPYFMVFSRKAISSECFKKWWSGTDPLAGPGEEAKHIEAMIVRSLERCLTEHGLSSDTYVSCGKYLERCSSQNPVSVFADEILGNDHAPFLRRDLLVNEGNLWTDTGEGFTPRDIIAVLRETEYPIELVYQDILTNNKISAVRNALPLTWIHRKAGHYSKRRLALVCYAYYTDLAEYMCRYLLNMPEGADLFIISSREETLDAYKKELEEKNASAVFGRIRFLMKPNRGRDVAALLVTFAPYLKDYDGFCFVHDKKSPQNPYALTRDFLRRSLECCLGSREYSMDLAEALFDENEHCGIMVPPTPYFSLYITLGAEVYEEDVSALKALMERLKLRVPFDRNLMAPFGTMFWARTDALADLLGYKWKYEDFPEEPMPPDHTVSHAIERVFCLCVQNRGYFPMWAMPESFAELYVNNLSARLGGFNSELCRILGKDTWSAQMGKLRSTPEADRTFRFSSYLVCMILSKIAFGRLGERCREKYRKLKAIKRARRIKLF